MPPLHGRVARRKNKLQKSAASNWLWPRKTKEKLNWKHHSKTGEGEGWMRWENPVTVLQFSFATHFPSSPENPSLNCKTFRSNAPLNPQNPHPSQWRFDLSTIWNRLHFYWPWLWLWNFILLAISIDLREKGDGSNS